MKKIINNIKNNLNIKLAIKNTGWMLLEKFIRMVFAFFIGIWVARYLSPQKFGVLNFSIAFVAFFSPFVTMGLNHIITRDLLNHREKENEILGTAFIIRLFGGGLSLVIAVILIRLIRPDNFKITLFVVFLSIGQIGKAFAVIDYWFQSYLDSKLVVICRILTLMISNLMRVIGILNQFSIFWFVLAYGVELSFSEISLVFAYKWKKQSILNWKYSKGLVTNYLKSGLPLILSGFAAIVYLKIDTIMIGQMISDTAVGVYSAATKISEVWYVIPTTIAASISPRLLQIRTKDSFLYNKRFQQLYILFSAMGIFVAVVVSFISVPLVDTLFGSSYHESGFVLRIHIWAGIFVFMRALFSKWILFENMLSLSLLTQSGGAIMNVLANAILIPKFGIQGAAIATLISYAGASYFILFFNKKTRVTAFMMTKALFFPFFLKLAFGGNNAKNDF